MLTERAKKRAVSAVLAADPDHFADDPHSFEFIALEHYGGVVGVVAEQNQGIGAFLNAFDHDGVFDADSVNAASDHVVLDLINEHGVALLYFGLHAVTEDVHQYHGLRTAFPVQPVAFEGVVVLDAAVDFEGAAPRTKTCPDLWHFEEFRAEVRGGVMLEFGGTAPRGEPFRLQAIGTAEDVQPFVGHGVALLGLGHRGAVDAQDVREFLLRSDTQDL